jgi:hypothetical protein
VSEEIGGNLPPFDPSSIVDLDILADQLRHTYAHLFTERDKYISAANMWLLNGGKIENDEEEAALTERIASILAVCDAYHGKPKSAHTLAKEPFLKGGRIVDAVLNQELAGPLNGVLDRLKKVLKDYKDAKVKRLLAEQAAEAKRLADVAAQAALSAGANLDEALAAEQASLDASAEIENSKPSSLSQSRGDLGALSALRGKWKARVTNQALIPAIYMMPDMALIEGVMNSSKDKKTGAPTKVIPGVEFYQETSLSIRR